MSTITIPTPDTVQCSFTASGLPKIIHQTWETEDIPEKWKAAQEQWKNLHPDWVYILWTDTMRREYIARYHPDYLDLYHSYDYNIQRADMIRYFILHDFGGLYSDLDQAPKKNFEAYLTCAFNYFVLSSNPNISQYIHLGLMISPRGSVIMKELQQALKNRKVPWLWLLTKQHIVPYTTGTFMVSDVLFNKTKQPFILLPKKIFNPFSIVEQASILDEEDDVRETYIDTVTKDSSWNSFDSNVFNFFSKYKATFAVIGIFTVLIAFVLLVYYLFKYRKCKKECKSECQKECVIQNPDVGLIEFYGLNPKKSRPIKRIPSQKQIHRSQ